jgi:hypothetical protein
MRSSQILAACGMASIVACRATPSPPAVATATATQRTVFTDSLMHIERCMPMAPGTDWRKVCTPKDQALEIRRKP